MAPLFGAGLFALVGGGSVAAFDAVTFVVAALVVGRIRIHEERPAPRPKHLWADLAAGLGHVRRTPELRRLLLVGAVVIGISGVVVPAQYSLVQAIGEPPSFLGALSAALGAGSIVASLLSGRLVRRIGEPWLAVVGVVDYALGSSLRAVGNLPLAVTGSLVLGFALPWVFLAVLNVAQRSTPLHLQGRVSSAVTLCIFGPQAPLQALGSLAIRDTGYRMLYVGGAAAAVATGSWFAWVHLRRVSRRRAAAGAPGGGGPVAEEREAGPRRSRGTP